ncbi:hypothetical protein [Paenibacillus glucanolyticus]|uniref:hypothetical protein n=1 Tax=Paenibacillus glucanolyticus TaxID=59843 RepID=UPI0015C34C0A|nr:hypothetical protein [Paenibacillus glucanolyticus]
MVDHQEILPIIGMFEENELTYSLGGSGMLYYLKLTELVNDWDFMVECSKTYCLKL